MDTTKHTFSWGLLLVPGLLWLGGCGEPPRTTKADSAKSSLVVQEYTTQLRATPLLYTATGTVHARVESQLASQLMARVQTVKVHEGDRVRAGQTLITLDAAEADAGYRRADAGRAEEQNGIAESDSGIAAAKANLDLASVTAERMNDLYSKRSISKQELDETTAKLQTAKANYDMAKARRAALTDRIAQSNAVLRQAQVASGYTVIRAPFAGVITARNVEPGTLAVPGTPLLTLEAGTGYRLHADVEESRLSLVHLKAKVTIFLDALAGGMEGQVGEISPSSDSTSHSYTVKINLPSNSGLHAGQFGHVSFTAGSKQSMTVPVGALVENGQLTSLFVNEGGVARARLITLGDKFDKETEVLSGLQIGEHVICPIPSGLADGDRVEARQ